MVDSLADRLYAVADEMYTLWSNAERPPTWSFPEPMPDPVGNYNHVLTVGALFQQRVRRSRGLTTSNDDPVRLENVHSVSDPHLTLQALLTRRLNGAWRREMRYEYSNDAGAPYYQQNSYSRKIMTSGRELVTPEFRDVWRPPEGWSHLDAIQSPPTQRPDYEPLLDD